MTERPRIGIIGARGWLGGAIVSAIVDADVREPRELTLSYRTGSPADLTEANWTKDNQALIDGADVVIVSVRPEDFAALRVTAPGKLVISVMAGVSLSELASQFGTERVVRAMPNAATSVRSSYTPWVASDPCTSADKVFAASLFEACGVSDEVESEAQLDYFAAFTGTGPAYHALLADTLRLDAISRGIAPETARRAATTLLVGSAKLIERDARCPSDVVQDFIDYEGMTAAALRAMRDAPLAKVVSKGIDAALARASTLQNTS